jgi:hypothetical protein
MEQETRGTSPNGNNQNQIRTEGNKLLSPKTSVLIQPRLRAPSMRLLYSSNINADAKGRSISTLLRHKTLNGKSW